MTCHSGTFCPLAGVASKVSLTLEPITALPGAVPGSVFGSARHSSSAASSGSASGLFGAQVVADRTWE